MIRRPRFLAFPLLCLILLSSASLLQAARAPKSRTEIISTTWKWTHPQNHVQITLRVKTRVKVEGSKVIPETIWFDGPTKVTSGSITLEAGNLKMIPRYYEISDPKTAGPATQAVQVLANFTVTTRTKGILVNSAISVAHIVPVGDVRADVPLPKKEVAKRVGLVNGVKRHKAKQPR